MQAAPKRVLDPWLQVVTHALEQTSAPVLSVSERCSQDLCAGSGAGFLAFCPVVAKKKLSPEARWQKSRLSAQLLRIEVQGLHAAKRFAAAATLVARAPDEYHCVVKRVYKLPRLSSRL